jgi:hypothetical protein
MRTPLDAQNGQARRLISIESNSNFFFILICSMIFYRLMRLNIFQWKTISFKKQYLINYVVIL